MLSDRCLSVLSVTLVYCGQRVGQIKVKLGTQVGLGPGNIVLDGNPGPPSPKGAQPPIFGPYLLWPNGSMDQDATWYGSRPRRRPYCARWRPSSVSPKRGHSPQFLAHVCCGQTARWIKMPLGMEVGVGPGNIVLDAGPAPPQGAQPPQISAPVCCSKTAGWINMPLGTKLGLSPSRIVLHGDPAPSPKRGTAPNSRPMSIVAKRSPILATAKHL